MSEHNLPSVAVKSHGTQTVAPVNLTVSPEKLADIWDEAPTRRAWWLDLHSSNDFFVGTTISDVETSVIKVQGGLPGSGVKTDAAPFLSPVLPVCECGQPWPSIKPFDWQCAKCKGVIHSLRDYLEAL